MFSVPISAGPTSLASRSTNPGTSLSLNRNRTCEGSLLAKTGVRNGTWGICLRNISVCNDVRGYIGMDGCLRNAYLWGGCRCGREADDASVSFTCGTTGERTGSTRRLTGFSDSGSTISADILSFSTVKWFTRNGETANIAMIWRAKDSNKARFVCLRIWIFLMPLKRGIYKRYRNSEIPPASISLT